MADNARVRRLGRWAARLLILLGVPVFFIVGLVMWSWGDRIWLTTFALAMVLLVGGRLFALWGTRERRPGWLSVRLQVERS